MTRLIGLQIEGSVGAWRSLGLTVDNDGVAMVGGIALRLSEGDAGIVAWELSADDDASKPDQIDGLPTRWVMPHDLAPNSAVTLDHVVVMTDDLMRTCDAIAVATGEPLKRIREVGGGRQQGFFRLGEAIIEVVGPAAPEPSLWGLVLNVNDIHELCDRLGPDVVGLPKPAVQPGRFIATIRRELNLGTAVALMSVDARGSRPEASSL
jgi:hypothetical protein